MLAYYFCIICCINSFVFGEIQLQTYLDGQGDNAGNTPTHQKIELEDFFWTGSGDDGEPEYLKKLHDGINSGKSIIAKTETVVLNVYIGNDEFAGTLCLDCPSEGSSHSILNTLMDRRYWLLTVLSGYYYPQEYPLLEDKLAKLYRLAFTRQQSQHLGIISIAPDGDDIVSSKSIQTTESPTEDTTEIPQDPDQKNISTTSMPTSRSPHFKILKIHKQFRQSPKDQLNLVRQSQIKVIIHNISSIRQDDIQNWLGVNISGHKKNAVNQTELVYSVLLSGKPVLAAAAAEDIKLLSGDEINNILENEVLLKAEPYVKEPQATPLVPSKEEKNKETNKTEEIEKEKEQIPAQPVQDYTILIGIVSVIAFLLIFLMAILLFIIKKRYKDRAKIKRLCDHQVFLSEHQKPTAPEAKELRIPPDRLPKIQTISAEEGIKDSEYEEYDFSDNSQKLGPLQTKDNKRYVLHEIVKPPRQFGAGFQAHDKKHNDVVDSKQRSKRTNIEFQGKKHPITNSYIKEEKYIHKHKHKKRYLSENRVGSIDSSSSPEISSVSNISSCSLKSNSDELTYNEVYNPDNDLSCTKKLSREQDKHHPSSEKTLHSTYDTINENIRKPDLEKIVKFDKHQSSSESGDSIESYLNMAETTVAHFPKYPCPETMSQILQPVTLTHYDEYDGKIQQKSVRRNKKVAAPPPPAAPPILSSISKESDTNEKPTFISRKSQSYEEDSSVLRQPVWTERKQNNEEHKGFNYDSVASRARFEGLLESAIHMFSSSEQQQSPTFSTQSTTVQRTISHRRKSATIARTLTYGTELNSETIVRPLTAEFKINNTTTSKQENVPISTETAWAHSSSTSSLIRPLSAGTFHRPSETPPKVDVARLRALYDVNKTESTAVPLIQAIQNELKKFKSDDK